MFGISSFAETPFASLSGATYNADVAEAILVSETEDALITYASAVSEQVLLTDIQDSLADFVDSITEAAVLDAAQIALADFVESLSDLITATDTQNGSVVFAGAISESAVMLDEQNTDNAFNSFVNESITGTDTLFSVGDFLAAISESSVLADSQASLANFIVALSDTATFADSQAGNLLFSGTIAESITATDATNGSGGAETINESASFIEDQYNINEQFVNVNEFVLLQDTFEGTSELNNQVNETVVFTTEENGGFPYAEAVSETASIAGVVDAGGIYLIIAESIAAVDSATTIATLISNVSETANLTGINNSSAVFNSSRSERIAFTSEFTPFFKFEPIDTTQVPNWNTINM